MGHLCLAAVLEEKTVSTQDKILICEALKELYPKEAKAINFYFGLKKPFFPTVDDLAKMLKVSNWHAKDILDNALKKLKHKKEYGLIKTYLANSTQINLYDAFPLLRMPAKVFNLSLRSRNCMTAGSIDYVWQLIQKTEQELLSMRNFGHKSLMEIVQTLSRVGLRLGMKIPDDLLAQLNKESEQTDSI